MSNEGSLKVGSFDLDSQKGIMHLLASVRACEINPEEKNELRDLIFLYMNGGKDSSVRISLEQKVSQVGIVALEAPAQTVTPEEIKIDYDFGGSRPAPSFSASKEVSGDAPSSTLEPVPVRKPQVVVETPTPTPVAEATVSTPLVEPEPVVMSAPAPAPEPEPIPVSTGPSDGLKRIREIKSLVNEKIGNPVNLVDIDNTVGREYMAAMLDAMKQVSAGGAAVSAMKRLEETYLIVEKTIADHENGAEKVAVPDAKEPVVVPVVPTPPELVVPSVAEPIPEPITPPVPKPTPVPESVPEPVFTPVPEPVSEPVKAKEEFKPTISEQMSNPAPKSTPHSEPADVPHDLPIQENPVADTVSEQKESPEPPSEWVAKPEAQKPLESKTHISSLAETKVKLKTPEDLPLASSLETSSVEGDSLFTKEVDEGLQQLLSEWSIFKKSGLFGTGPKGREHPLFNKISGLQIPLLLAGRFEGATQEIKQSITDYMNGWRYEQGIIYEHGENFDHYLRRVIRHILDLQNKNISA
jgi:hypothetical protein